MQASLRLRCRDVVNLLTAQLFHPLNNAPRRSAGVVTLTVLQLMQRSSHWEL